nr:somatomedin-B and thrombospondin type-1 domain-containing protein-like isoform X4 [Anser cygnoides]XP_047919881.1 somatomedin-B and thrombospondin type-1 domain-containing protein-like isoform X4 [Anser cygnoides]
MRGLLLCGGWLLAASYVLGGCRHRCCPGRNNACWAPGAHRARCYCDSYCERTGDCCQDYQASCRRAAVGCVVGPWGPWSSCSSPCGVGSKDRSRQVTVPPRHGGEPCPDLKQRRGCLGDDPACGPARGVAKVLPDSFGLDFRDPWRRAGLQRPEEPPRWRPPAGGSPGAAGCSGTGGCASSAGGTRSTGTPAAMGTGCKEPARQRVPDLPSRTFWVAASVAGCQGSWVREALQDGCTCPSPALVFV